MQHILLKLQNMSIKKFSFLLASIFQACEKSYDKIYPENEQKNDSDDNNSVNSENFEANVTDAMADNCSNHEDGDDLLINLQRLLC